MSTENNQNKVVAIPSDWLRPGAIIPFTLDNFGLLIDAVRSMTTPSAMQPTSSASKADLAALFKELSTCDVTRDGRKTTIELPYDLYDRICAAAIVPPVVQAPTNEQLRKVLHKYSRYLGSDHHSDTEFASLQDVMAFAREVLTLAAPIVATVPSEPSRPDILEKLTYHKYQRDDLTLDDCLEYLCNQWKKIHGRTERAMVMQITELLASQPVAAPIVATVPSDDTGKIIYSLLCTAAMTKHPDTTDFDLIKSECRMAAKLLRQYKDKEPSTIRCCEKMVEQAGNMVCCGEPIEKGSGNCE